MILKYLITAININTSTHIFGNIKFDFRIKNTALYLSINALMQKYNYFIADED